MDQDHSRERSCPRWDGHVGIDVQDNSEDALAFLKITLLGLPGLMTVIAPVALLIASIQLLNRLSADSELIVMTAAGAKVWAPARPLLWLAVLVSLGYSGVTTFAPLLVEQGDRSEATLMGMRAVGAVPFLLGALLLFKVSPRLAPIGNLGLAFLIGTGVAVAIVGLGTSAFDVIEAHGVTVTALVPALAQVWTAATEWEPADVSSLRLLQVGGSKLGQADAEALDAALGPIGQQVFGMAEGLICYTRLDDPRELVHRSQGAPMSEFDDVRIVDENGDDVPDGEEGELLVRGPYTIRGYYRAGEQAANSFTPDGYYRSGDAVRRLAGGYLTVTGRIKDTVVRAGENVAADDVEENLTAHPSIRQAAVVGVPDPDLGERISALVVASHDHPPGQPIALSEVRSFLTGRGLAAFKLPDEVHTVASLPVTAIGKVDKKALRAELQKENA